MGKIKKIPRKGQRSFRAQVKVRSDDASSTIKLGLKRRQADKDLRERAEMARDARTPGSRLLFPIGGAHRDVSEANAQVRSYVYLESNHSPPNDSYKGSPYDSRSINDRPAHSMLFYHHRSPRGRLGGASSTGGSGVNKAWSAKTLNELMKAGKFGEAMYLDFVDLLNTTAPNRGYYALALWRAALYAFSEKLIDGGELEKLSNLLGPHMDGNDLAQAMTDYTVAEESRK